MVEQLRNGFYGEYLVAEEDEGKDCTGLDWGLLVRLQMKRSKATHGSTLTRTIPVFCGEES
jgi:hypothetical protein